VPILSIGYSQEGSLMQSVSLVTTKGGSGKSTSSIAIAVAAFRMGHRVVLIDIDRQQTCVSWGNRRQFREPTIVAALPSEVPNILQRAERLGYDLAVVDGVAHDVRALVTVARAVDLNVLVCRPTRVDIEVAMQDRALIGHCRYAILLTQTPPALSARLHSWRAAAVAMGTVVDAAFGYRVDYQDALAAGCGVTEWRPTGTAADEVRAALHWIQERLAENHDVETDRSA
jgi:chromosome partitioning protein